MEQEQEADQLLERLLAEGKIKVEYDQYELDDLMMFGGAVYHTDREGNVKHIPIRSIKGWELFNKDWNDKEL